MDTNVYSKEQLQMFKDAFLVVKGKALTCPDLLKYGVCFNTQDLMTGGVSSLDDAYAAVDFLATGWPHGKTLSNFSTLLAFFVPHTTGYGIWEGPNLEMRLDLLGYLIAKCDELIDLEE